MTKDEIVRAWCTQRIGCPYIYGATGKACTPAYREARMAQYPAYAAKIKRNCPRLSGSATTCQDCRWCDPETGEGKPAYDCAQFSRFAMDAVGISLVSGANSQWEKTRWQEHGDIADLPNDLFGRVFLVFRWDADKKRMGHVGVYTGDGYVIHAKGHDYGVVCQKLDAVNFSHFGVPYGLYEDAVPVDHPTLRQGDKGDAVKTLQNMLILLNYLPVFGSSGKSSADGIFGPKTEEAVRAFQRDQGWEPDGVVGPATWDALEKATAHDEDSPEQPDEPPADDPVIVSREDWDALCRIVNKYKMG